MSKPKDLAFFPIKFDVNAIGSTRALGPTSQLHAITDDDNTAGIPADAEFVEVLVSYEFDSVGLPPNPPGSVHWFSINLQYGLAGPDDLKTTSGVHYQQTLGIPAEAGNFHNDVVLGNFRVPVVNGKFSVLFNELNASDSGTPPGTLVWQYTGYWRA